MANFAFMRAARTKASAWVGRQAVEGGPDLRASGSGFHLEETRAPRLFPPFELTPTAPFVKAVHAARRMLFVRLEHCF